VKSWRWVVVGLWVLGWAGCEDDERPEEEVAAPEGRRADGIEEDLLDGLDDPPRPGELVAPPIEGDVAAPSTIEAAVPDGGCVAITEAPTRIWARSGIPAIVAGAESFYVALHARSEAGEDELAIVAVAPGRAPRPVRSLRIDPRLVVERIAPPGVALDGEGRLLVAYVDGRGKVRLGSVAPDAADVRFPTIEVGSGADPRFAPAVASRGRNRLVAWTDGSGTPMRVKLAVIDGRGAIAGVHDLNTARMGASAPVFADEDVFFLDARAGVSPIVRAPIGADGRPLPSAVARPVGTVADPPELAVARGGGHAFGAYTAVGNLATTAVGLVRLDGDGATPVPLVAGTGYGVLHVAAASAPGRAIFAADAPKDTPPSSPREIHVRLVHATEGGAEAGPALVVAGPDGTARHAAIARRADGTIGVAFESASALHVAWLRCDDQR
jgi:hypothetical protein